MTLQSCWTFCKDPQSLVDHIREIAPDAEITSGESAAHGNKWVNVESEAPLLASIYQEAEGNGFVQMWNDEGVRSE